MEFDEKRISDIMNLIGYGLAKFDMDFVSEFGFSTRTAFYQFVVDIGLAKTIKAVTNRQDSFDPYFENNRRGWYQRRQREHIKLFIDSLFGDENSKEFANIVKFHIQEINRDISLITASQSPITKSKFKQLQETGKEAEYFFMNNYRSIEPFSNGILEDARLWGDGYDFQISIESKYNLVEVKGVRSKSGAIRLTQNEFDKAQEYHSDYYLVVVSNLAYTPKLNVIENPTQALIFTRRDISSIQANYCSENIRW